MSDVVKKYKDGKYHATFGEYRLSEVLKGIENAKDVSEHDKILAQVMFQQGFELGYSAAMERMREKKLDQLKQLIEMDPEQLKSYVTLYEGLNKHLNLEHEVVED